MYFICHNSIYYQKYIDLLDKNILCLLMKGLGEAVFKNAMIAAEIQ